MATSEGGSASRRRKRAWRQPRQAAGPTSSAIEPTTEHVLLATSESRSESSSTVQSQSRPETVPSESRPETSSTVSDGVTESKPRLRGEEPVTELDGSVMEGVGCDITCGL